ncbi:hypothetical protein ABPG72_000412 [Tetrahymena utriculariae]
MDIDRNYLAEPFADIEKIISKAAHEGIGKTDSCLIAMMLDKYNFTNVDLIKELINYICQFKDQIVAKYTEKGLGIYMIDLLFELYFMVKQQRMHVLVAVNTIKELLNSSKELQFPLQQKNKEKKKLIYNQIIQLIQLNCKRFNQKQMHYDVFLQSYWMCDKIECQSILNLMDQVSQSIFEVEKQGQNKDTPYNKFKAMTKFDIMYLNEYLQPKTGKNVIRKEPKQIFLTRIKTKNNIVTHQDLDAFRHYQQDKENERRNMNQEQNQDIHSRERQFERPCEQNNNQKHNHLLKNGQNDKINLLKQNDKKYQIINIQKVQYQPQQQCIDIQPQIHKILNQKKESDVSPIQQQIKRIQSEINQEQQPSTPNQLKKYISEQNNLSPQTNKQDLHYPHKQDKMQKIQSDQSNQQKIERKTTINSTQPKFFSEEIDSILKQINELTQYERELFMKLFGKYEAGMSGQLLDDLKKRYPDIYYLIKSCKALEKVRKIKPRSVQIISCLIFLYKQKQKGRILQINTGEGKSITVALMAATRSLMKDKVDVYTSNKELAKRDCEEFQEFYQELGLTCGSIGQEEVRSSEPNETYKKDIVYGDVGSYAADLLGDYYEQRGTRCSRMFDFAIVDEVDCMFIDQHNHSTSLAKSIPGLSKLNTILWLIWYKITQMRDQYLDGYYYFVENMEKKYCCRAEDFITEFINQVLMSGEVSVEIDKQIPSHMKSFAMSQMKEWINNGFNALQLQRNKEYKVENDKIIPIDYDNTGIAQQNTQWRGGLHQFIQMKENVTVTPMNMTVNFVSNIYMFLLYKSNLVGLTGTLGTFQSLNVLEQFYTIDALKVPPFKPRKLQIFPPLIEKTTLDFQKTMISEIGQKMQQGRPCLIISESEKFCKYLSKLISKKFSNIKIIEYYSGDESIEKEQINEFCIIISTNLAGRGTDIKLSPNIINNGGLHVIVTFTPKNKRVEDQAFGRAGRCGQDGSAQMVIDGSKDSFIVKNKIQSNLIEERDKVDAQICERQLQNMKDISKMDEIFWDYCKTLNTCEAIKNKQYMRKQEEEIWATFYCKIQFMRKEPEKVRKEYAIFKEEFQKRVNEKNIVNPSYLINEGMKLLMDNKFTESLSISDEVIQKNPNNLAAHYIKAVALLSLKKHAKSLQMLDKCEEILAQKNDLHQALQIIQLQSQSLVQQEYNQELLEQSLVLSKHFQNQLQESKIFNQNKYDRKQLESYITQSGCFKRIKDEEVIRGKIQDQIRELKTEIKELYRNPSKKESLQFIQVNEYFQDDQITEQMLKEHQNEEIPFIIELFDHKPLKWKSLIPLACGIFQLANSLYLLQAQQILQDGNSNSNTPSTRTSAASQTPSGLELCTPVGFDVDLKYPLMIEEQDRQVQGIASAVKKIADVEGLDLKDYLSKKSLLLIESIRKFQINDYIHTLTQISESSADRVQNELMIQISLKKALTKEVIKYSPEITFITSQMAQDQKFQNLRLLSYKFQENCKKILEQNQVIQFISTQQIHSIYRAFKKSFSYLSFSQFQKEIVSSLSKNICKNHKKSIIENLESFIKENYELQFSSNSFTEVVSNLIQQPIYNSANSAIDNIENVVIETIRQHVLAQLKAMIKSVKSQIRDLILSAPKVQGLVQQKQYSHLENKLKNHQIFYSFLKEDKELLSQYPKAINQAIQSLKIFDKNNNKLMNFSETQLKGEVKYIILKSNQKITQYEELLDVISQTIIKLFENNNNMNNNQFSSSEIQQQIFKKLQIKLLNPAFKIVSHVFQQQIESNAIYGLFKYIIQ